MLYIYIQDNVMTYLRYYSFMNSQTGYTLISLYSSLVFERDGHRPSAGRSFTEFLKKGKIASYRAVLTDCELGRKPAIPVKCHVSVEVESWGNNTHPGLLTWRPHNTDKLWFCEFLAPNSAQSPPVFPGLRSFLGRLFKFRTTGAIRKNVVVAKFRHFLLRVYDDLWTIFSVLTAPQRASNS